MDAAKILEELLIKIEKNPIVLENILKASKSPKARVLFQELQGVKKSAEKLGEFISLNIAPILSQMIDRGTKL